VRQGQLYLQQYGWFKERMSFLNDLKSTPLLKDMPSDIKVVKEKIYSPSKRITEDFMLNTLLRHRPVPTLPISKGSMQRLLYTLTR
jgi:hypothetical protein